MTTLLEIESAIQKLPEAEARHLSAWLQTYLEEKWDRQLEADVVSRKLDKLIARAEVAISAGNVRDLDQVLLSEVRQLLQNPSQPEVWQYLVFRPHPWRKQLYIKGHKLLASTVWQDLMANQLSPEQAAENWDLPLSAIYEAIQYCESHQDLLKLEANEERYRLEVKGISVEPAPTA